MHTNTSMNIRIQSGLDNQSGQISEVHISEDHSTFIA